MKGKRRFYVYEIICDITKHHYIGQRSNCYVDPETDPYMGSGKILNFEKEKFGIEHFQKIILYEVANQKELDAAEKKEIEKCRLKYGNYFEDKENGLCINLVDGGLVGCGFSHINNNPKLREKAMEAAKKARAEKHNGDCMGACHTYDACMKNIQNKKERGTYDISINAMHSKASREKAKLTAHLQYLFVDENGEYHKMARNTAKQHHKNWKQVCKFEDANNEQKEKAIDHSKKK